MKKYLLGIAMLSLTFLCKAQQFPANYNYVFNPFAINPAYAGYNIDPEVNFASKSSFQGIEGAPRTIFFSGHGQIYNPKVSLGANFMSDKIGVTSTTGVYGSYAYKLISRNRNVYTNWGFNPHVLSLGLRAGVTYYKEDLTSLNVDGDHNFEENVSFAFPNVGFGIYYSKNHYFVGLSIPELITTTEANNYNLSRNIFLNTSYQLLTGVSSKVNLNALVKYAEGAPIQADFNTQLEFKDKLLLGVGYRTVSRLNFILGFMMLKDLQIGYIYDTPIGNANREINFNSHELTINYRFIKRQ
ncbi:PorP/SprF family type IX secretion system membrane protein [Pseudochryseolinea flava]|uniref:Type IX secretion system membrane protein PorP/SprF n=1 Tax=Pseudochryseolinea flava TaxID=2059302 RepID=A0A364Y7X6_9BACT|nr:PorP/SprF family type IX secretion system membrane protein [Pseudochryseolinea flava]RAW02351.1 hypothetical protein DQQ10_07405 [Pseudochryseolinea flava]